jgi:hypothetical protein
VIINWMKSDGCKLVYAFGAVVEALCDEFVVPVVLAMVLMRETSAAPRGRD